MSVALACLVALATASADVYLPEPTEAMFRASVAPSRLPAREAVPVSLLLSEKIRNPEGGHPPPLKLVELELDRRLLPDVEGLPACHPGLQMRQMTVAELCEPAQVGIGKADVEVAFPEQQPTEVEGSLQVFNGGHVRGQDTFWLYVYLPAPVAGGIMMPLKLRPKRSGIYGLKGRLEVPKIANGAGSITYLGARFRKGIFSASCPSRPLQAHASSNFANGEVVDSALTQRCKTASG